MNIFNYHCNTIRYKGREYPFREVWLDEYASVVLVSIVNLSADLLDSNDRWNDALAEYIDNKIIYYLEVDEINESDNYLQNILIKNIL